MAEGYLLSSPQRIFQPFEIALDRPSPSPARLYPPNAPSLKHSLGRFASGMTRPWPEGPKTVLGGGTGCVWEGGRAWRRGLRSPARLWHCRGQGGLTGLQAHLIEVCSDK